MNYMSKTHFCHISPINYLHLTKGREVHLTLAHLVDNKEYTDFYKKELIHMINVMILWFRLLNHK